MFYGGVIEGQYVDLRSADESDAEFTLKIRQDPEFTKFLPKIENTLTQQKDWIRYQRRKPDDYFFVVLNKKGERIGTIGLFDIKDGVCEGGRLAIRGNAFENIEAQMLCFCFAFEQLNINQVINYIYVDNSRAIRFNQQFGGVLVGEEGVPVFKGGNLCRKAINTKEAFSNASKQISAMLYRKKRDKSVYQK